MSHIGYHSHTKSKGSKLGYYRASLACSYCRKRKIRCIPSADDEGEGCTTCARLNRPCVTVARAAQLTQRGSRGDVSSSSNTKSVQQVDSQQKKVQNHPAGHTQLPSSASSSEGSANFVQPVASLDYPQPWDSTLMDPLQTQITPLATDLEPHGLATGFHGYHEYFPFHYLDPLYFQPPAVYLNNASRDYALPSDFINFNNDRSYNSILQSGINPTEHPVVELTAPGLLDSRDGDINTPGYQFTDL